MALSSHAPRQERRTLTLHPILLQNWRDVAVIGLAVVLFGYLAVGELAARGSSSDYFQLSWLAFISVALLVAGVARFRRVSLVADSHSVRAVNLWGKHKKCCRSELSDVVQVGSAFGRTLQFIRRDNTVAFEVLRNVWTKSQLRRLSEFLDLRIIGLESDSVRSYLGFALALPVVLALDLIFVVPGGALLVSALQADTDASAYVRAYRCPEGPVLGSASCIAVLAATVRSVGDRSFGEFPLAIQLAGNNYEISATSSKATYSLLKPGLTVSAKLWRNKVTYIDLGTGVQTTDNPLYQERSLRSGIPFWIVLLFGIIPLLSRLHPVVTWGSSRAPRGGRL